MKKRRKLVIYAYWPGLNWKGKLGEGNAREEVTRSRRSRGFRFLFALLFDSLGGRKRKHGACVSLEEISGEEAIIQRIRLNHPYPLVRKLRGISMHNVPVHGILIFEKGGIVERRGRNPVVGDNGGRIVERRIKRTLVTVNLVSRRLVINRWWRKIDRYLFIDCR